MIPVLVAYLALLLFAVSAQLVDRPRWIDKLAVVALLSLAMLTKPGRAEHLAALHATAPRSDPVLTHGDYLLVSVTTGDATLAIGVFGRVFVFQWERSASR
ncbi:hypothetical protein OV203_38535 [Nannocystis sp. ILAH1]|uniref:hypothetical protein n=1 Tax=Nannocystis sp. ILAH1 TaxID=2996789 RepID=UPI00226DB588|nr:hypothetical protein [Nannocystis sp. ILAH1]MCY0993102.1 hypothetical protein [Nannocystis sp. ILAH1]